ncbi:hypothetical protein JD77_04525 [Micromonospora olivasterospora]|uniref:Uncharacterized protein n=1 Tax=Micromonospora olivasterospora TaxID=1880 RepID=A0A562IFL5_MICOL|nr:hypothetical protein JD77_04525 [Micromonospora olivasterospora]
MVEKGGVVASPAATGRGQLAAPRWWPHHPARIPGDAGTPHRGIPEHRQAGKADTGDDRLDESLGTGTAERDHPDGHPYTQDVAPPLLPPPPETSQGLECRVARERRPLLIRDLPSIGRATMRDMAESRNVQRRWAPELTEAAPEQRIGTPRPGHGTIYVYLSGTGERVRRTVWTATWEDPFDPPGEDGEVAGIETREGTRQEILSWVRSQPAATLLLADPDKGGHPYPSTTTRWSSRNPRRSGVPRDRVTGQGRQAHEALTCCRRSRSSACRRE